MAGSIDQDDEDFFDLRSPPAFESVRLSHLNNKSSVLCPKSQNMTSQYLALQQLEAHQKMIARAKGIVDNYAPQSSLSYISVVGRQKKKLWRKSSCQKNSSESKEEYNNSPFSPRPQAVHAYEEDNASLNASSMNRAVQTGTPYISLNSNTGDKISWYLEALNQGALSMPPFIHVRDSNGRIDNLQALQNKRTLKGDILDTHTNCFSKSKKPFSPRIVADSSSKSKLKEMRCYQPPVRRKKKGSENSSDTFESYQEEDDDSEGDLNEEKPIDSRTEEVETEISRKKHFDRNSSHSDRLQDYLMHQNRFHHENLSRKDTSIGNKEDKYLEFLSKVTEHILRSGVYSDRAIQQAFEFHLQFYQEEENKDNFQSLLSQIMESMKISNGDSDEVLLNKNLTFPSFSRPNTPPVKEEPCVSRLLTDLARNEESTDEYAPSLSSQAQNVTDDFLSDQHLLSDSGISSRLPDS